tara:strand:+ start:163 stop:771 length:609 start_codon:yes stop_codon:yes gene_type:complete
LSFPFRFSKKKYKKKVTAIIMSRKRDRKAKDHEYDQLVDRTAWHPYQHECGFESLSKVEDIESKFRLNLDSQMTFYIKAQPNNDDGPEDDIPEYELTFRHDAPVLDILAAVREQEGIDEHEELFLIYADITLDEGKTLASYRTLIDKERNTWSKPYAGVIWIAAEGHVVEKTKYMKPQGYYQNDKVVKNIFHRRNSMKNMTQ